MILVSGKLKSGTNDKCKEISQVNIGILGHVDHGKTTLTHMLTGKFTDEHSEELKRGISIRLGYADMQIRKCMKCKDAGLTTFTKCTTCAEDTELVRTVSIVDAPGHETLMATVLTGASLVDGAILVIAANEKCPQPQTAEHLAVLDISEIKNIIVVQNKIDLVSEEQALENYQQIKNLLKGSVAENAPIIPISAQQKVNLDLLLEAIEEFILTPDKNPKKDPKMYVVRSFDINHPRTEIQKLHGGVLGGSLIEGVLSPGDEIEIRPGIMDNNKWTSLKTKIISLRQGSVVLEKGTPGGLLAVETLLDPYVTKSDNLVGDVIGYPGKMPPVRDSLKIEIHLMERVVGSNEDLKLDQILQDDVLLMNVGTGRTVGVCTKQGKICEFKLKRPVCASEGDKVALSKQINSRWRLIGYGIIK